MCEEALSSLSVGHWKYLIVRDSTDIIYPWHYFLRSNWDFPRPDLGQLKNEQTLPKMVLIIPNFFVLHSDVNFMKIRTKLSKLQMHVFLLKIMNGTFFSFTFLCKFS